LRPHIGEPRDARWATPAELAGPRLQSALDHCGRSLGTDRDDIRGQRLVEVVTWCLAVPSAHALLADGELPDLERPHVWVEADPPDGVALTLPTEARVAGGVDELRAAIGAHAGPLIAAVNDATRRPAQALERAVEDRIAAAIVWVAQMSNATDRARTLLDGTAELRMLDLGTHELLLHVRAGCCLYYRLPAGLKCFSCPLIDDEHRRRLVAGDGA
jgi:hypothetical protein